MKGWAASLLPSARSAPHPAAFSAVDMSGSVMWKAESLVPPRLVSTQDFLRVMALTHGCACEGAKHVLDTVLPEVRDQCSQESFL